MAARRRNRQRASKRRAAKHAAVDTDAAPWPFKALFAGGKGGRAYRHDRSDLALVRQAVRCDWLPDDAADKRAAILRQAASYLYRPLNSNYECRFFLSVARLFLECDKANLRELRKQIAKGGM